MHSNRSVFFTISIFVLVSFVLAACQPAATPTAAPTAIPTKVPPTEVLPTPTAEPITLTIKGAVNNELQLTESALRAMNVVTLTLEHPKNGPSEFTGVRLSDLLNQAGLKENTDSIILTASDGYTYELDMPTIQACADCLVAFDPETAGVYNAAMPGQSGKAWVKTLVSIELVAKEPVTLTINGLVNTELQLTDSALKAMTIVTKTLEHPKNGPTEYTGVLLSDLLAQVGIGTGATTVSFIAADGFSNDLDIATVQECADCMVSFDPATPGVYNLTMPGQTSGKAWVNGVVTITLK
jgi:hypothetical protein